MFVKCVQNNQVKGKKFTGYGQILPVFLWFNIVSQEKNSEGVSMVK